MTIDYGDRITALKARVLGMEQGGGMKRLDFDFDDGGSETEDVAGSPQGDGDFETDNLPDTGQTSAGGQIVPKKDVEGVVDRTDQAEPTLTEPTGLLEKVIDEISHGTLLP